MRQGHRVPGGTFLALVGLWGVRLTIPLAALGVVIDEHLFIAAMVEGGLAGLLLSVDRSANLSGRYPRHENEAGTVLLGLETWKTQEPWRAPYSPLPGPRSQLVVALITVPGVVILLFRLRPPLATLVHGIGEAVLIGAVAVGTVVVWLLTDRRQNRRP